MPPAQRDAFTAEMQAAGIDWRLVVYGGALPAFHHTPTGPDGAPSASGEYEQPVVPRRRVPPAARAARLE